MGNSNSFSRAVGIGFVRIRVPHLDARQRRANEMGHPAHIHCLVGDQRVLVVTKDPPTTATLRLLVPDNKIHRFARPGDPGRVCHGRVGRA